MQSHMIQRMVFELNAVGLKSGLESERKASEYHDEIIEPAVEACFSDIELTDSYLVIDSLDIDLGVFTPDSFKNEAGERLIKHLGSHLKQIGRQHAGRHGQGRSHGLYHRIDAGMRQRSTADESEEVTAGRSGSYYNALLSFLERGRFPWWFDVDHLSNDIESELGPAWAESLTTSETAYLKQRLLQSANARSRLTSGFSAEWTGGLLQRIGLAGSEAWMLWNIMLPAFHSAPRSLSLFRHYFWTSWIVAAGKEEAGPDIQEILRATAPGESQQFLELLAETVKIVRKQKERPGLPERVRLVLKSLEAIRPVGGEQQPDKKRTPDSIKESTGKEQPERDDREETGRPPGIAADHEKRVRIESTGPIEKDTLKTERAGEGDGEVVEPLMEYPDIDEREPLFLQAAGMVLLHPFLAELFEKTGLWEGKKWLSDDAPFHAVGILSYLSYNEVDVPEYRLLFHKILVGLEPENVLPPVPLPGPGETASCDELLEAVIRHWKALRNTSPDGLREMFLKREGKLVTGDDGYLLHIEKRTEDILLSRLPWGCSIVKLPWMDKILNVSWV